MTVADISSRIMTRLEEDPAAPISTTAVEVLAAINEGQQLAAFLTLCLETTLDYTLAGTFYTPRSTFSNLIVPLKITVGGVRLRPSTIAELDAFNTAWQYTYGTPARYMTLGCNLLAVTPQLTSSLNLLRWTEDFSQVWMLNVANTLTTGIDDPLNGTGASRFTGVVASGYFQYNIVAAGDYTFSVYLRKVDLSTGFVQVNATVYHPALTTAWQRFDFPVTLAGGNTPMAIYVNGTGSVDVFGPQLQLGALTAYQKMTVTSATSRLTYAYSPTDLLSNGTPVIPAPFHPALVEYGVYRVKLKEGAQGLARGLRSLNLFLDSMTQLGDFTRAKSRAARYDVMPFELALFDRSKLIDAILRMQAKK